MSPNPAGPPAKSSAGNGAKNGRRGGREGGERLPLPQRGGPERVTWLPSPWPARSGLAAPRAPLHRQLAQAEELGWGPRGVPPEQGRWGGGRAAERGWERWFPGRRWGWRRRRRLSCRRIHSRACCNRGWSSSEPGPPSGRRWTCPRGKAPLERHRDRAASGRAKDEGSSHPCTLPMVPKDVGCPPCRVLPNLESLSCPRAAILAWEGGGEGVGRRSQSAPGFCAWE